MDTASGRRRSKRPRRPAAFRRHLRAAGGPAVHSGAMEGFAMQQDLNGLRRFQAYGFNGAPLTAPLNEFNFCVWAITTQFPHLDCIASLYMALAFLCAGLEAAMARAWALVLRNSPDASFAVVHCPAQIGLCPEKRNRHKGLMSSHAAHRRRGVDGGSARIVCALSAKAANAMRSRGRFGSRSAPPWL